MNDTAENGRDKLPAPDQQPLEAPRATDGGDASLNDKRRPMGTRFLRMGRVGTRTGRSPTRSQT